VRPLAVRGAREQLAFLETEFATRFREMELVEKTVAAGLIDSDPLSSARLAAAQAKVDEGLGRRRVAAAENALRALIGAAPGESLPVAQGVAAMPGFGAGVPSELLLRRPDLAAAAARLDAAVSREGAARADFYPSVTLTGQAGCTLARRDEALAARTLSMVVWERRQVAVRLAASTGGGWSAQ